MDPSCSSKEYDIESQSENDSESSSILFDDGSGVHHMSEGVVEGIKGLLTHQEEPQMLPSWGELHKFRPLDHYRLGYSSLAGLQDCDPNLLIFRKFGWVRVRVLLKLQDEMAELENELKILDKHSSQKGNPNKILQSCRNDALFGHRRQELLLEIRQKLLEYDKMFLHLIKIKAIEPPTRRNIRTLFRLIWNNKCQVHEEIDWIYRREDLAALAQEQSTGWFTDFLVDVLHKIIGRSTTMSIFSDRYGKKKKGRFEISLLSPRRLALLVWTIYVFFAAILLLALVVILHIVQASDVQAGRYEILQMIVILASILLFAALSSTFTKAKRFEVLLATLIYCAILMIWLGIVHDRP